MAHGNSIRALLMVLEHITEHDITGGGEVANAVPIVFDRKVGTPDFVRRKP